LACIASRLPGSTDVIIEDQRNGFLVPPGDVAALSAAIAALLPDAALRERIGAAARATVVERYSSASVADRWLDMYQLAPTLVRW
jgi:glycosyltransferase involved in cell wall biosynthesis